jgi:hypothetical protein
LPALNPVWQIDRRRTTRGGSDDAIDSNAPVASVQPADQNVTVGTKASLAISATDDGLPNASGRRFRRPMVATFR